MSAALTLLLVGSLLQGALCGEFKASMPQTIEVLRGSCVTIPCSFEIVDQYKSNLDNTCRAIWMIDKKTVFNSSNPLTSSTNGELRGDLTRKDCTTTLNNMQPANSNNYFFRLECDNDLKWNFADQISISFTDVPPRPTLTPSALKVKEGTSVRLTCSAPAPCLSHPPTVTWTPDLGESVETLQENQDKTKVKTSVVTFTASQNHHGKTISCTASYNQQDGSTESAVTSLTADISYSPKDTSVSVRPSGPVPEGSNVTLTCSSTANPAVKSYTWYRADGGQEALMGTGAVLNIKASKDDSPFFCKTENIIGAGRSNLSQIDVQFAPQILSSSDCIKAADQLNCSCRTVGNPSPTLLWYLDGSPVNHSDKFVISNEPLNDTGLWSIITVNGPQERDLSTLLCRSSNSLGSATQRFCVNSLEAQTSSQGRVTSTFFIVTVGVLTAALICALLFAIRAQRTVCRNSTKSQCTGDTSSAVMSQGLTGETGNKVPCKSSEEKNEEGSDVLYSSVIWRSKSKMKKGERSGGRNPSTGSYLEEERCMEGGVSRNHVRNALEMESLYDKIVTGKDAKKTVCTEYAQVNFRDQNMMQQ
ncbi:sialic acid-binding Ig-like lectin 13 [Anarhichas minor]|uniref:sialic acid-binding Ig-like lectin 13 n=1 Tax=Anarhichas minor TaxID=65739 RepID=UPI003F733D52